MRAIYLIPIILLFFSCQSKKEKEQDILRTQIINRSDSLLAFSSKITEDFLIKNKDVDCEVRKLNFKGVQKTYNQIALQYKEQSSLLNIPEDSVRYKLGMANKVLQDKEMANCVGLSKGYEQFQYFLTQLKLK